MFPRICLLDRYIAQIFLRTLLICFASFTGLYIVIDLFGNLEEFLRHIERFGAGVLVSYYGPRILTFFDQTSHLLTLIAALFVITWMQRTNELTAVMAAGIPKRRVVQPLLLAGCLIALLAALNREIWIPQIREKLTRNAQTWAGDAARTFTPVFDFQTRILFTGKGVLPARRVISQPVFQLPDAMASWGSAVTGAEARYLQADGDRPAGYLITEVTQPDDVADRESVRLGSDVVILTPRDAKWLDPDQVFVASDVTFDDLAFGRRYRRYLSTWELVQALRNASLDYGADARVLLHARIVQPLLDLSLLVLGLPLVTRRQTRSIFVAGGMAMLLVIGFLGVTIAAHTMGGYLIIRPASLAAWLPLLIFGPCAFAALRRGWE